MPKKTGTLRPHKSTVTLRHSVAFGFALSAAFTDVQNNVRKNHVDKISDAALKHTHPPQSAMIFQRELPPIN
jgi:hypothetical protein